MRKDMAGPLGKDISQVLVAGLLNCASPRKRNSAPRHFCEGVVTASFHASVAAFTLRLNGMKNIQRYDTALVGFLLVFCTLYGLTRLDVIFETVVAADRLWHPYPLDAFLTRNPNGILGMIPSVTCSPPSPQCLEPRDIELGKLADPMMASGYIAVFSGLWLSMWLDGLYRGMSGQLRTEGIVPWTDSDDQNIEDRRFRFAWVTAWTVVVIVFCGMVFSHFRGFPSERDDWEFMLSAMLLGGLAGHRLGSCAAYGLVAQRLNNAQRQVALIVGHADGAGGARRIGEFMAFQGILVSIPIAWLTFWLVVEWHYDAIGSVYGNWIFMHLALFALASLISWFGFLRPLLIFTAHYRACKAEILQTWHRMTDGSLEGLRSKYREASSWEDAVDAIEACEGITETTQKITALHSVPLRPAVRGIFSFATLFPAVTFVVELAAPEESVLVNSMTTIIRLVAGLLA
ncbi:hypothetical protein [Aestuariicoccus sp. MJ-SS9]|uniref:hypothetical protein n=1 Tax=Aestuariicoccus sp. MJ-SS9 TaxID=3079855 RepID=UPI0029124296|nr:hypothetical protein [Aestuariicoccus sp. MJ-SS9]MDU8912589.1 hypothetical protein [Aestuariicoccus sp. MJ-SS9]